MERRETNKCKCGHRGMWIGWLGFDNNRRAQMGCGECGRTWSMR